MMETKLSPVASETSRQQKTLSVAGNDIIVRVGGQETDNEYSIFELTVPTNVGAGLHIDKDWDEWWYVIEGKFAFTLNGERIELNAGGFAYGPKGIPHSFKNVGETTGKMMMVTRPSGLEIFFRKVHEASLHGTPDKEAFVKIMRSHNIEPA